MKQLKVKFALRHNSSVTWSQENPILLEGEPGIETDTNKLKLGNGRNHWKDLPYFQSGQIYSGDGQTIEIGADGTIAMSGFSTATPEDSLPLIKRINGINKIQWTPVKDLVVEAIDTRTYGDDASIVTKQGSTNNTLIGSLKDFDKATANQIPYKTANNQLSWKNEYKYDDTPLIQRIENLEVNAGKIDEITIEGQALPIVDKKVDIPLAMQSQYGLVKLGEEFSMTENSGLVITSLNVNKLTQTEGERLVLQTGGANVE